MVGPAAVAATATAALGAWHWPLPCFVALLVLLSPQQHPATGLGAGLHAPPALRSLVCRLTQRTAMLSKAVALPDINVSVLGSELQPEPSAPRLKRGAVVVTLGVAES